MRGLSPANRQANRVVEMNYLDETIVITPFSVSSQKGDFGLGLLI